MFTNSPSLEKRKDPSRVYPRPNGASTVKNPSPDKARSVTESVLVISP